MTRTAPRLAVLLVSGLLGGLLGSDVATGQSVDGPTRLTDVSVESAKDGPTVRIKTTGTAKYDASLIDTPNRLLIDFASTVYALPRMQMPTDVPPIREIRGSQFRPGVARIVVEMTRPMGYRIEQTPDGLVVALEPALEKAAAKPKAVAPASKRNEPPVVVPDATLAKPVDVAKGEPRPVATPVPPAPQAAAAPGEPKAAEPKTPEPKPVVAQVAAAPAELKPAAKPAVRPVAAHGPAAAAPAEASAGTPTSDPKPASALPSPFVGQVRPATPGQPPTSDGAKLISLDFKDAEVLNLLRILAAEGGRNIVAGDDVRGKVSVSLRNVTWEEALDTILETRGLAKIEKGNVIRVVSLEQLTKEREAQARVEEAKRRAEAETRVKAVEAQIREEELEAKRLAKRIAEEETIARGPLREETIRLSYANPVEVADTLRGILGIPPEGTAPVPIGAVPAQAVPAEPPVVPSSGTINPELGRLPQPNAPILSPPGSQGMVSVSQDLLAKGITIRAHKPTNSVFIRHYEKDLERIRRLIRDQLDVALPQVKIEARMEILDRVALEAIGIEWGGSVGPKQAGNTVVVGHGFTQAQDPASGTIGPPILNGNLVNLPMQLLPFSASQLPAAGIAFGIVGTDFNINLALQALATQGKTRTLARPEIVTVENNKATVSLGEEIPYATVSSAGTQIQFKEALLKLDVTPTVIRERVDNTEVRRIKMVVVVENNSRGDLVNLGSGGTPPAINRRKAETQVLIREGERLVIGGVTQTVVAVNTRKVPFLGDTPILGWLFKSREHFETGRELVIFVTPSLLRHDPVTR